jgi:hypothetical protein
MVLVLLVAGVTGIAMRQPTLIVRDSETGKRLYLGKISPGEKFELHYIHSVEHLPVQDLFVYKKEGLVLEQTRCINFGAGLGYAGQGVLREEGKWSVIDKMNRKVGVLPLRVGTIADHTIVCRGTRYRLAEYFPTKSLVYIEVVKSFGVPNK